MTLYSMRGMFRNLEKYFIVHLRIHTILVRLSGPWDVPGTHLLPYTHSYTRNNVWSCMDHAPFICVVKAEIDAKRACSVGLAVRSRDEC